MSDIMTAKDLNLWYDKTQALKNVNITIPEKALPHLSGRQAAESQLFSRP